MTNAEYQRLRAISSHWLIAFLRSPRQCREKYIEPKNERSTSTDALRLGSAVHCLTLTPHLFEDEFFVLDFDRRSKAGRATYNAKQESGLIPLSLTEWAKAHSIAAAIKGSKEAWSLLRDGQKEKVFLQPRQDGLLPLKARLDVFDESSRRLIELKTTDSLRRVDESIRAYGYLISAAFYQEISRATEFLFVFVEKEAPYHIGVYPVEPSDLRHGKEQWQAALVGFDVCWQTGEWPERYPRPSDQDDDPLMVGFDLDPSKQTGFCFEELEL